MVSLGFVSGYGRWRYFNTASERFLNSGYQKVFHDSLDGAVYHVIRYHHYDLEGLRLLASSVLKYQTIVSLNLRFPIG
jgi:hypothetical protein